MISRKMISCSFLLPLCVLTVSCLAVNFDSSSSNGVCTVTNFNDVLNATATCLDIIIKNITVPGGVSLYLELLDGASITFEGTTIFEHAVWMGPLLYITGNRITVKGAPGSVLDGQGHLYWDGAGDFGSKKPRFFHLEATDSVFEDIHLRNCPHQCTAIDNSTRVTLSGWNIDCSDGDPGVAPSGKEGHNTDGFNVHRSQNITVKDSVVKNQDDCVCVNQGSDMEFTGLHCTGSHGLSVAVGVSQTNVTDNIVTNVLFFNNTVVNSMNGIHIKTVVDGGQGYIDGVTYKDIKIIGATSYGINVQQDYLNAGPTGSPNNNINITNLNLYNIQGTVTGKDALDVYILCGEGSCYNWEWTDVSLNGSSKSDKCNFTPSGFSC